MTMRDEALKYAEKFNRVLPVYEVLDDGTCSCTPPGQPCSRSKPGKHPRIREWQHRATDDERQVWAWWSDWPNANIGIAVPERTIVFDVDPRDGGDISQLGTFPETVMARSGSGGWHVWFTVPEGVKLRGGKALPGVDIRKLGNYVLVEPSRHASGGQYVWEPGRSLLDISRATIPAHLLDLVAQVERPAMPRAQRRSQPNSHEPTAAETGLLGNSLYWLRQAVVRAERKGRNDSGFWLATQVRDDGVSQAEAERIMRAYAAHVADLGSHPYMEEEALKTLTSVYSQPPREPARRIPQGRAAVGGAGGGRPASGASSAKATPAYTLREDETQSATVKEREAASSSFTSFIHSQKTEPVWEETYQALLERMRTADELPDDGVVQHAGSNAQRRRRAQYAVLQEVWALFFPQDPLPLQQMSTWLNAAEQGMEGEMVMDMARAVYVAPHNRDISAPRALVSKALLNAVHLEGAPRRQEQTSSETQRGKVGRTKSKTLRPQPSEQTGDATRAAAGLTEEDVRKAYQAAHLNFDAVAEAFEFADSPQRALDWLNRHLAKR